MTAGELIAVPETPTKVKYNFIGWSVDGDGLYDMTIAPADDITLYAVWEKAVFTVSFEANGGMFNDGGEEIAKDVNKQEAIGDVETPYKKGYTFKGWYYGGEMWNTDTIVDRDITLVAIWELIDDSDSDKLIIQYKGHEWQDKEEP
jgi:uncharacterized repeat protein (TIGR02543 family)